MILRSSLAAANAIAVLGIVISFITTIVLGNMLLSNLTSFILEVFMGLMTYWVLGFIFALILSIPLTKAFQKLSNKTSLLIFILVGFAVPFLITHYLYMTPNHLLFPPYDTSEKVRYIAQILSISLVGSVGAFASWFTLYKHKYS